MKQLSGAQTIGLLAISTLLGGAALPSSLTEDAQAIVVGEIQSGQQVGRSLTFTLSIERVVKGDVAAGAAVNVSTQTRISGRGGLKGQYGLWFLRRVEGHWVLIPVFPGSFALETSCYFPLSKKMSPQSVRTITPPTTVSDKVAIELAAALQGYANPLQLYNLTWGLKAIGENASVGPELYRILRTSSDPQVRFVGLTGLLGGDDGVSALAEIADNLPLVPRLHTSSLLVGGICGVKNPDPRAVAYLGRIALSPIMHPTLPRCAAMALNTIHTLDAVPLLAQLLGSTDPETREHAMQGMSRFVDNLPIPTAQAVLNGRAMIPQGSQPYRTTETDKYSLSRRMLGSSAEAEYLQFWRSWWVTMSDKLGSRSR